MLNSSVLMNEFPRRVTWALMAVVALLAGCDQLGIESPEKLAAARVAEGNAIGGACRHAGRAIEDCYALNKKADKAAVLGRRMIQSMINAGPFGCCALPQVRTLVPLMAVVGLFGVSYIHLMPSIAAESIPPA